MTVPTVWLNYSLMANGRVVEDKGPMDVVHPPCDTEVDMAERIDPDEWKTEFARKNKETHQATEDMYGMHNLSIEDASTMGEIEAKIKQVEESIQALEMKLEALDTRVHRAIKTWQTAMQEQGDIVMDLTEVVQTNGEALRNSLSKLR